MHHRYEYYSPQRRNRPASSSSCAGPDRGGGSPLGQSLAGADCYDGKTTYYETCRDVRPPALPPAQPRCCAAPTEFRLAAPVCENSFGRLSGVFFPLYPGRLNVMHAALCMRFVCRPRRHSRPRSADRSKRVSPIPPRPRAALAPGVGASASNGLPPFGVSYRAGSDREL